MELCEFRENCHLLLLLNTFHSETVTERCKSVFIQFELLVIQHQTLKRLEIAQGIKKFKNFSIEFRTKCPATKEIGN